jgi:hypothetical protein
MEREAGAARSVSVPDIITAEQYYDARRGDVAPEPLRRLMFALLKDALSCLQNNAHAKSGSRRRLFVEVKHWVDWEGGHGPFSFDTVCETLGIEPQFLRQGLKRWRKQQLAGSARTRLTARTPVIRLGQISAPIEKPSCR